MPKQARYRAVSNLVFWSEQTIEEPAQLLSVCEEVTKRNCERGIDMERIFLVDKSFKELTTPEQKTLIAHHNLTQKGNYRFRTKVRQVQSLVKEEDFGICTYGNNDKIVLEMKPTERLGDTYYIGISSFTILNSDSQVKSSFIDKYKDFESIYNKHFKQSVGIQEYINQS